LWRRRGALKHMCRSFAGSAKAAAELARCLYWLVVWLAKWIFPRQ
jgi:hypothetical protein